MDVIDEYTTTATASDDVSYVVANVTTSFSRIHPKVNKTLGGSGSINATIAVDVGGWNAGDPTHKIINSGNAVLGTFSSVKGVFIKHSGFTDDARTVATSATLTLIMGSVPIAILGKGGAIVLPFENATTPAITATSSSGDIAVEVMGTA